MKFLLFILVTSLSLNVSAHEEKSAEVNNYSKYGNLFTSAVAFGMLDIQIDQVCGDAIEVTSTSNDCLSFLLNIKPKIESVINNCTPKDNQSNEDAYVCDLSQASLDNISGLLTL